MLVKHIPYQLPAPTKHAGISAQKPLKNFQNLSYDL